MSQNSFQELKARFRKYANYFIVFLAIVLTISLIRNILKTQESIKTIEKKELQLASLEEKNKQLEEDLRRVQSDEFVEKQLRDQLGLAKEGEIIIVLPEAEKLRLLIPDLPQEEEELPDPNWRKWLKLFL